MAAQHSGRMKLSIGACKCCEIDFHSAAEMLLHVVDHYPETFSLSANFASLDTFRECSPHVGATIPSSSSRTGASDFANSQSRDSSDPFVSSNSSQTPKVFLCRECGDEFCNVYALREHVSSHGQSGCVCPVCEEIFADEFELMSHLSEHMGPEWCHACDKCLKRFTNIFDLQAHFLNCSAVVDDAGLMEHIGGELDSVYVCNACGEALPDSASFHHHLEAHVRGDETEVNELDGSGDDFYSQEPEFDTLSCDSDPTSLGTGFARAPKGSNSISSNGKVGPNEYIDNLLHSVVSNRSKHSKRHSNGRHRSSVNLTSQLPLLTHRHSPPLTSISVAPSELNDLPCSANQNVESRATRSKNSSMEDVRAHANREINLAEVEKRFYAEINKIPARDEGASQANANGIRNDYIQNLLQENVRKCNRNGYGGSRSRKPFQCS